MKEVANIGMSMWRLVIHVGSFVLYLISFLLQYCLDVYTYVESPKTDLANLSFWTGFIQLNTSFLS
jgi:hypothetical protein